MIYSAWGHDGEAYALIPGPGPPVTGDGKPYTPKLLEITGARERIWLFEAEDWDAAVREFDRRKGWTSQEETGKEAVG